MDHKFKKNKHRGWGIFFSFFLRDDLFLTGTMLLVFLLKALKVRCKFEIFSVSNGGVMDLFWYSEQQEKKKGHVV